MILTDPLIESIVDNNYYNNSLLLKTDPLTFNPIFWIDAQNEASITKDGSDKVSSWNDLSGNGNNASQSTEANKPTYVESSINGLPALEFDGINDYFDTSSVLFDPSLTNFSIFAVAKFNSRDNNAHLLAQNDGSGAGRSIFYKAKYLQSQAISSYLGGVETLGDPVSLSPQIYNLNNSSGTLTIYTNGTLGVTNSVIIESADGTWVIGAGKTLFSFMDGNIGEIIIYDRALSTPERQQVEQYLANKWGIT